MQEFTFCGPEKESCVENRTLKDKSCLIPCTGLYADVAVDQNVMKGDMLLSLALASIEIQVSIP